jgi:hypothetical protein
VAKFVEIDFEDEDDIIHNIDIIEVKSRLMLKRILDEITSFGYHVLQSHVPRHTSYLLRHVDREQPRWRPGGAGGGGEYESVVGVKRGTSKHPFYVEFGTGLYGAVGWFIVPNFAQYMTFYSLKYKKVLHLTHTRGQRPQRYMYITWREMLIYARGRMMLADMFR